MTQTRSGTRRGTKGDTKKHEVTLRNALTAKNAKIAKGREIGNRNSKFTRQKQK